MQKLKKLFKAVSVMLKLEVKAKAKFKKLIEPIFGTKKTDDVYTIV